MSKATHVSLQRSSPTSPTPPLPEATISSSPENTDRLPSQREESLTGNGHTALPSVSADSLPFPSTSAVAGQLEEVTHIRSATVLRTKLVEDFGGELNKEYDKIILSKYQPGYNESGGA